jgi:aminoglycoside phosphotransferase (APT) family kinase protein
VLTERDVRLLVGTDASVERMFLNAEFDVWAIGDDLVAKFPRTEVDAAKLPVEQALHPMLRGLLGDVVPAVRMVGATDRDGRPFIVHDRARGRQGQTIAGVTVAPNDRLAVDVGRLFGALHTIDADEARGLGAGTRAAPFEIQPLHEAAIARTTAIVGDAVPRFLASPAPAPSDRRTLCHTDVKGEHLFVDDERRRVTAIIDWADAEICDPAKDYAGLVGWLGPSFTRACIEASGEEDPTLAERAIWLNRASMIEYWDDVLAGVEDAPIPLITAQLQASFSD